MYTGIVQACLAIDSLTRKDGLSAFSIVFPEGLMTGLDTGMSVSVNGVCLTVTRVLGHRVFFDAIRETLELSNLRLLAVGSMVNIERSARQGAEVGGHILSGHVVGTAPVVAVERAENNRRLIFAGEPAWLGYVFEKGFLAVNGCSLTVAALDRSECRFAVNLIPETLTRTNFGALQRGDLVNIEVESQTRIIVETVERIMAERYSPA